MHPPEAFQEIVDFMAPTFLSSINAFSKGSDQLMKCVVSGGFGLLALLRNTSEYRDIINDFVKREPRLREALVTTDIDIKVITLPESLQRVSGLWKSRWEHFTETRPDFELKVSKPSKPKHDPVQDYDVAAFLFLTYRGSPILDMVVTDADVIGKDVNLKVSRAIGMPVMKIGTYLETMLRVIYASNVPGIYPYLHDKRHPVTGTQSHKGRMDIVRARMLCEVMRKTDTALPAHACRVLTILTLDKLESMDDDECRKFFQPLANHA
jgi:hypothetical protein